jgi:hypothetical protein
VVYASHPELLRHRQESKNTLGSSHVGYCISCRYKGLRMNGITLRLEIWKSDPAFHCSQARGEADLRRFPAHQADRTNVWTKVSPSAYIETLSDTLRVAGPIGPQSSSL